MAEDQLPHEKHKPVWILQHLQTTISDESLVRYYSLWILRVFVSVLRKSTICLVIAIFNRVFSLKVLQCKNVNIYTIVVIRRSIIFFHTRFLEDTMVSKKYHGIIFFCNYNIKNLRCLCTTNTVVFLIIFGTYKSIFSSLS